MKIKLHHTVRILVLFLLWISLGCGGDSIEETEENCREWITELPDPRVKPLPDPICPPFPPIIYESSDR